jgi:hypothetical protein
MCRVSLSADEQEDAERAARSLAEHLPKAFSSAVALPEAAGHKAVYLAVNAQDLTLREAPESPVVVADAPQ